jgi:hypothetical protein
MTVTLTMVLLAAPPLFLALGSFAVAWLGLERLVDLRRVLRLRFRGRGAAVLAHLLSRGQEETQSKAKGRKLAVPPAAWIGLAAGIVLALLWHHPLLSSWFVALGVATGWMLTSTGRAMKREDLRALEVFISSLRSVLSVGESIFVSLETVADDLDEGPLRTSLVEAARRYRGDYSTREALSALAEVGWPRLDRLALILGETNLTDDGTMQQVLRDQEGQVQRARHLQDRADAVLTLTRLTLRVLQAFNLAALGVVTGVPAWRAFYLDHPLGLVAATGAALAGTWYFSAELRRMEDIV